MIVKGVVDEDFVNYREAAMLIAFPTCTGKCGWEQCQNKRLNDNPNAAEIVTERLVSRFIGNPITSAVVCGGLEPLDSFGELLNFLLILREQSDATVVIYTGYTEDEVSDKIDQLRHFPNIIMKFGRYLPNHTPHFDTVLGVNLSSDNQYGKVIS